MVGSVLSTHFYLAAILNESDIESYKKNNNNVAAVCLATCTKISLHLFTVNRKTTPLRDPLRDTVVSLLSLTPGKDKRLLE